MNGLSRRIQAMWRVLWQSHQLEGEMHDEMRFHVEMEAERLQRDEGLELREALRQAHVRFGGVEKFKEEARDARGRQWIDAVALDARLGVRMLAKHRGLTLVGGFAIAVAIAIGATFFEVITEMLNPALPLPDGGRVVSIEHDTASGGAEPRVLHELLAVRDMLVSIEHLSAFRTVQRNLIDDARHRALSALPPEPVKVAEMSASGFAVARTPPLIGALSIA